MKILRKLVILAIFIVATVLCCNFLLFAKATSSEADKVNDAKVSSPSEMAEEYGDEDDEESEDDDKEYAEEPEEDQNEEPSVSSPSDAESEDDAFGGEELEEAEEDEVESTPSEANEEIVEDSNDEIEEDTISSPSETFFESEATPSDATEEIDDISSPSEIDEATPSAMRKMLAAPKFGASDPNNIYMYFDTSTSTMHFTDDNTKELYRTTGTGVSGITGNNIPSYLNSIGVTTSATYPNDVLSVVFDADLYPTSTKDLFCYMNNLTSITGLNKLHTENVTTMEAMFTSTGNLTSIDLSGFNTQNVEDMSFMFAGSGISSFNASFNTAKVTEMADMFYGCPNLASADLTSFNTGLVTDMHNMFFGCPLLTTVNLSSFNTSSVINMGCMFCAGYSIPSPTSLTNIYVSPSFVISGGCNSTDMFKGCVNLPGYDPANVDGSMLSIYTKPAPTPTPPAPPVERRFRDTGGSGGGGGGGGGAGITSRKTGPTKENSKVYPYIKKVTPLNPATTSLYYDPNRNLWYIIKDIDANQTFVMNGFYSINGVTYYIDEYGIMAQGWVRDVNGDYYLFDWNKGDTVGQMIIGWKEVNDKWYYFGLDGKMAHDGITPDGCVVASDGAWIKL